MTCRYGSMSAMKLNNRIALVALLFSASAFGAPPAEEIAALESRFNAGLDARDAKQLEPLLADPFTWVHSSDGRVDDRKTWLESAARGMALAGQRNARREYGSTLITYGEPAHTAVRISRVRLLFTDQKRESWMRQTHTWVRNAPGEWKLAMGQGVVMYDGQPLDSSIYPRYAGTYELTDGRKLTLYTQDDTLLATFPSGAQTQIFLASPTEEVVRNPGAGSLHFVLGENGAPVSVSLMRAGKEAWRATRK